MTKEKRLSLYFKLGIIACLLVTFGSCRNDKPPTGGTMTHLPTTPVSNPPSVPGIANEVSEPIPKEEPDQVASPPTDTPGDPKSQGYVQTATAKTISATTDPEAILLDSIVFDSLVLHYDTITEGDVINRKYFFTNKNKQPIEVAYAHPDCGCTAPSFPFLPMAYHDRGYIGVSFNSVGKDGAQESLIKIGFKGIKKEKILKLKGYVKAPKPKEKL